MCQCVHQAPHILLSHEVVPLVHEHNVHTWSLSEQVEHSGELSEAM